MNYREIPAVNQSLLIALSRGIGSYKQYIEESDPNKPKNHFDEGDAFDCLMTTPNEWEDKFFVSNANKPDGIVATIINDVVSKPFSRASLEESIEKYQYGGKNWKSHTKGLKILAYKEFIREKYQSNGKIVLSKEQYQKIRSMELLVKSHLHTRWIQEYRNHPQIESKTQVPIVFEYRGIKCKVLLDEIFINHADKWVLPIDYKTIGDSVKMFPKSARQRRYDVQGAFYRLALNLTNSKDYTVLPFHFVVASTTTGEAPLVYELSKHDEAIATIGGYYTGTDYIPADQDLGEVDLMGINQMVDLYKWHKDNDIWDVDKYIYESNGLIQQNIW